MPRKKSASIFSKRRVTTSVKSGKQTTSSVAGAAVESRAQSTAGSKVKQKTGAGQLLAGIKTNLAKKVAA